MTWFVTCLRALGVKAKSLVGGRWCLCGTTVFETAARLGHRRCEPFEKGRLPVRSARQVQRARASPPRVYCEMGGKNKISLTKRAAHQKGWQTISCTCRGVCVTRQVKTFLATSRLVSGPLGANANGACGDCSL